MEAGSLTTEGRTRRIGLPQGYRNRRRLALGGILALLGGGIAAAVLLIGNTNAPPQVFHDEPAQVTPVQKKVPLSDEAKHVAMRFVQTAVARKNLAEGWLLSGPVLRGGLSRKEWLTGNNPVVPYPIDELDVAPYKVDYSYADSALLELALLPKKNAGVRAQVFFLRLEKIRDAGGEHWVVNNWVPRASAVTPR
jgi:hypothetical protein